MTVNGSEPPESPRALPATGADDLVESPSQRAEEDQPGERDAADLGRELEDLRDRYLRLAADFDNFKRRRSQERAEQLRYASEDAARALLPVFDNLQRAVEHAPDGDGGQLLDGLNLVVREFRGALERLGVTPVPTVGQPFDPSVHEAIGGVESDEVDRDTVVDEVQPGYLLHDRLIRPALVRVAHPRHPFSDA